jgi:hypothetical protein
MGIGKFSVLPEMIGDCIKMMPKGYRVVGSAASAFDGVVTLLIENKNVPDGATLLLKVEHFESSITCKMVVEDCP